MTDEAAPVAIAPKVDPETLAIRSRPARAIRFKRGAIVAIVAVGSVSLSTVAWMALRPHGLHHVIQQDDGTQPAGKVGSDALNGLPASYGDVPKLGPPLPGDLGKPILEHQQSTLVADAGDGQRVDANAAAERERVLAEAKSARESAILVHGGATEAAAGTPAAAATEATTATDRGGQAGARSGRRSERPAAEGRFLSVRRTRAATPIPIGWTRRRRPICSRPAASSPPA